jgi:5,10-methylenetetrahydrofolate reductase
MNIVNKTNKIIKKPLKKLILDGFNKENGKFFYSFEVTPKAGLEVDFTKLKKLPLFVDVTWISNHNLKFDDISRSCAFELSKSITCTQTVNSLTCFQLEDFHIDEILKEDIHNLTLLRGGKNPEI